MGLAVDENISWLLDEVALVSSQYGILYAAPGVISPLIGCLDARHPAAIASKQPTRPQLWLIEIAHAAPHRGCV